MTRITSVGQIYFVQRESGGPIKIGHTERFTKRIRDLELACGEKLKVLFVHDAPESFERDCHRKFIDSKTLGEWFQPTEPLQKFIEVLRQNPQFIEGSTKRRRREPTEFGLKLKLAPEQGRAELKAAIAAQNGNVAATARELGVSVESVWIWIRRLGLKETVSRARLRRYGFEK